MQKRRISYRWGLRVKGACLCLCMRGSKGEPPWTSLPSEDKAWA